MTEFMECPFCGKSVRSNAAECHRCHRSLPDEFSENSEWGSPEHADGGYSSDEEYEESSETSSEQDSPGIFRIARKFWFFIGWLMILVFLLPFVLQALEIFVGPL
jgi:hypothetical protein